MDHEADDLVVEVCRMGWALLSAPGCREGRAHKDNGVVPRLPVVVEITQNNTEFRAEHSPLADSSSLLQRYVLTVVVRSGEVAFYAVVVVEKRCPRCALHCSAVIADAKPVPVPIRQYPGAAAGVPVS